MGKNKLKKLRTATYTAAVCKFRGGSECGTAQLSLSLFILFSYCSRYVAFVKLINLNDLLDDVTFPLLTKQRPRKCDMTEGQMDRMTDILTL